MTTITLDATQVTHALNQLSQRVINMQPAMVDVGKTIALLIDQTFINTHDPYDNPWAALSPVTIAKRRNSSSKPLNDTGRLKASITSNATQHEVTIGTTELYGKTHQFGANQGEYAPHVPWGDIPARPFLPTDGLPALWQQDIIDVIRHHLESGI